MTRDKIIDATLNQYAMFGYHGATMQKIAAEVGIKPASIYFFYKNKKTLFTAAFQTLLEDHFSDTQRVFNEIKEEKVEVIFETLLKNTVIYHKGNLKYTRAYMSLITSPPSQMTTSLHTYMKKFDIWFNDSLIHILKRDKQLTDEQALRIIRQFILLLDAIFWEINLYEDEILAEQVEHATNIIIILLGGVELAK